MRRIVLSPPRLVLEELFLAPREHDASTFELDAPERDELSGPALAQERRRPLFRPRRGWFRRFERWVSRNLDLGLYPWVPGVHLPYTFILDRRLTLSEARVEIEALPPAFSGLRVLLITDIHAGPFVSAATLARTVRRLMTLEPDLILLGGDQVTSRVSELETHAEAFSLLRAPLGVFAVLGNHDHYTEKPVELRQAMQAAGIGVLHNRHVVLRRGDERLSLAGVDDLLLGEPDLDRALAGAPRPLLLLSHNPDLLFDAARRSVDLMLSGHTHAGQIRVPGLPVLVRQSRYRLDQGRYRALNTDLVVSRGLGAVGVPLRVACPPEAVLLRLEARKSPA